jgi:hypothetical protein
MPLNCPVGTINALLGVGGLGNGGLGGPFSFWPGQNGDGYLCFALPINPGRRWQR